MAEKKQDHSVLIVDDEEPVGRSLGRLLKSMDVRHVYVPSGEKAIEEMKTTDRPFSLILSDQRMPGMTGAAFLEKAKELSPDTIRFLITGFADINAVTEAVNKGSIHRYISKPWDSQTLVDAIRSGLDQYGLIMDNHRLFALAKEQNAKLYNLSIELKKKADLHQTDISRMDRKLAELSARLENGRKPETRMDELRCFLEQNNLLHEEKLIALHQDLIAGLFDMFQEIAFRNGFEMPETIPGE